MAPERDSRDDHTHPRHLVRSHAHEEDIPGTVNLQTVEGDDTAYGQALFPVPADDPNDPLQWSNFKKTMILLICAAYSFLGNSALLGPSVYIGIYSKEFNISPTVASGLVSYPNLAFGFGSLILVPLYLKIGRRPVMLISMLLFLGGLIGASRATTFSGLMVARVFHGLGSGVCEALPVQLVNDIFFLHERGKRIGYYTVALCLGATGPFYAGYMLAGGYSWRLFFYVEIAFASALFILAFLFVEETTYHRHLQPPPSSSPRVLSSDNSANADGEKGGVEGIQHVEEEASVVPQRKSFLSTLKPWGAIDHEAEFFLTMVRPFTYFTIPAVFWVISTYGIYIGLGALAFNFTFPLKIVAPPYNWPETSAGLIALANGSGYLLAIPFTFTSDRLAAHLTRRNGMIREAEMRLPVLLPAMIIAPAGLILYGLTAQYNLHWFGYMAGVAMVNWGAYFYFSFTLAYAVDSYNANTSEMLIAMNLGKQAISFGMGVKLLDWILERGFAVVIAGIFGSVLAANNLALIIFWFYGKKIRIFTRNSWLGGWHKKAAKGGALTH
ncbi:putative MFS transporter [Halenospora varia]|nr:putative MFS transporter [Halenospora varia]